jgi:signal transduction histidine kinase
MSKNLFMFILLFFAFGLTAQTNESASKEQSNVNYLLRIDTAIRDENLKLAFYFISQIKINLKKAPSKSMSALVYWKEGRAYNTLQQYEKAQIAYLKAVDFLKDEPNTKILANIYYDLGLLESYRNRIDSQFPYFSKAIELHQQNNNYEYIARSFDSYGYAFSGLGQQDSAIFYAQKALSIQNVEVSKVTICNIKSNLGGYFLKKNQLDSAEYWLMSAMNMLDKTNMEWDEYIPYDIKKNLAEVYLKTGRRPQALAYLKEVLKYAQQKNDPILLKPCFEIILQDATLHNETANIIAIQKEFIAFQQNQEEKTSVHAFSNGQTLLEISMRESDYVELQRSFNEQAVVSRFVIGISLLFAALLVAMGYFFYQKQRFSKKLEAEVERQTASLRQSNAELERFAFVASHDLRTPLRNVISFLNLIERRMGTTLTSDVKEYMQFARTYAIHMNQMIDDILNYSKLQNVAPSRDIVTDVNKVFEKIVLSLDEKILEKNAKVQSINALPRLKIDETNLTQVLQNLLENALNYNKNQHPSIQIGSKSLGNETCLYVCDNGIGIESKYHDKVFEMFSRLHTMDEYAGTGLGLAITKKIVTQHGGRIWLESKIGEGTTFFVAFPN